MNQSSKTTRLPAFLFALLMVTGASLHAEIANTLSFQGQLSDNDGNPINGRVDITFAIYDESNSVASLWSEVQLAVAVSNGAFSAELGSVALLALNFDKPYYLGIKVGSDSEMSPRQKLTAVPYAVRGKNRTTETTVDCGNGEKIQGAVDGKIVGQAADGAGIEVYGVHNIIIRDITIADGAGFGVLTKYGASALLEDSVIENHQGYEVWAQYGAVLRLSNNTIRSTSNADTSGALHVGDGGIVRIEHNNFFTSVGPYGTIPVIRGSTIRMFRANTDVQNNRTRSGSAIDVSIGSILRQDGGHAAVSGSLYMARISDMEFRDVTIAGDIGVSGFSNLRFRHPFSNPANVTVTGTTNAWGGGHIDFTPGVRLDGDLNCSGGTSSDTTVFLNGHT